MPEWLRKLLLLHGSLGFADTLKTLAPDVQFQRANDPYNSSNQSRAGITNNNTIGLTSFFDQNFDKKGLARKGYAPVDSNQKFGDYVIGHEFGHVFTHSPLGQEFSQTLDKIPETQDEYEQFADDFQNSVQFLRSSRLDSFKLNPQSKQILSFLLKQEIYKNHPLNHPKIQAANNILNDKQLEKESKPKPKERN